MPEILSTSSLTSPTRSHRKFSYLTSGPSTGPLIIFIHGWPDIALTWRPQILLFAGLGFRCAAMDTLGYGHSAAPHEDAEYSQENLVKDQLEFLEHLGADKAVWVAHDWGCGILWSLVSHHPEKAVALIQVGVPYRTLECGLDTLKSFINRDIYPEDQYPNGQWDYQVYYELTKHEGATKQLDLVPEKALKLIHFKGSADLVGKPARTSEIVKVGGWFGASWDPETIPDVPLSLTAWENDTDIYEAMVESAKRNGFHGATSYYLNHSRNADYNREDSLANKGVLDLPILYIDALYDSVCTEAGIPAGYELMRKMCKDLKEVDVNGGHWARLERQREVNSAMVKWAVEKFGSWWPKDQVKEPGQGVKL